MEDVTVKTSVQYDDFARYLASYLKDNQSEFIYVGTYSPYIQGERLYELIKRFRQELP